MFASSKLRRVDQAVKAIREPHDDSVTLRSVSLLVKAYESIAPLDDTLFCKDPENAPNFRFDGGKARIMYKVWKTARTNRDVAVTRAIESLGFVRNPVDKRAGRAMLIGLMASSNLAYEDLLLNPIHTAESILERSIDIANEQDKRICAAFEAIVEAANYIAFNAPCLRLFLPVGGQILDASAHEPVLDQTDFDQELLVGKRVLYSLWPGIFNKKPSYRIVHKAIVSIVWD